MDRQGGVGAMPRSPRMRAGPAKTPVEEEEVVGRASTTSLQSIKPQNNLFSLYTIIIH